MAFLNTAMEEASVRREAIEDQAAPLEVVFLTQDLSDVSTIKRVAQLEEAGLSLFVCGFRRDRYNQHYEPPWPHAVLGRTKDGHYLQRAWAMVCALRVLFSERRKLRQSPVIYARNIDQLALALLVRLCLNRRVTIIYEVLDIQPAFVGNKVRSIILRAVERLCLTQVRLLVLSSPGFHRHYYVQQLNFAGPWLLLENKLCATGLGPRPAATSAISGIEAPPRNGVWVVGYFGLIRGQATFDLICRLAERLQGRVVFKFQGVLTTVDKGSFDRALATCPHLIYEGRYDNPDDLDTMYSATDFAWAIDLEHTDDNSRWLLPNRFYEAGYFGVPCLAVRDFEVGRLIKQHGVGWDFGGRIEEELVRFFETVTPEEYARKHQRLLSLPRETFVAGEEIQTLYGIIKGQHPAASFPGVTLLAGD